MMSMELIDGEFSICKTADLSCVDPGMDFCFTGRTDRESSLVCRTRDVPGDVLSRDDGWRMMRVAGVLDMSLVGVLSVISSALAGAGVPMFAISTYDTDYILVKAEMLDRAMLALERAGYSMEGTSPRNEEA